MPEPSPPPAPCPPRLEPVVLQNAHVRLEPLAPQHLAAVTAAALSDPRIFAVMRVRLHTPADVEGWLAEALADHAAGHTLPFVVFEPGSGSVVGSTRLFEYRPARRGVEIGWTWYVPRVWGTALNPAAKLALMTHAFETLGCARVQYTTDFRNTRSRAAIARLGAVQEGILRKDGVAGDGQRRDTVVFSILDDEWPAARAGLLARLTTSQAQPLPPSLEGKGGWGG